MTAEGIVGEYEALVAETDADLVAMQMGDFYEFFGDAARTVEAELDLKVSERSAGGEIYEMAGVPVDELQPYLTALVERGYRVAVAEQVSVDGGHERRIDRVVTPGTLTDPSGDDARYLATVVQGEDGFGLAFVDVTTGEFLTTELQDATDVESVVTELYGFGPAEVLPGPALREEDALIERVRETLGATLTLHDVEAFARGRAIETVRSQFGDGAAESVGLTGHEVALRAAGAAIDYIDETEVGVLPSITRLQRYVPADHVELDATTQRTLELTEPMTSGGQSLLETIDHTVTSAGGRELNDRLVRPTRDRSELETRLDAVEALAADAMGRERLGDMLGETKDLARLSARAATGTLGATGLVHIRDTLGILPAIHETVEQSPELADSPLQAEFDELDHTATESLHDQLDAALAENPGPTGEGAIRPRYDDELAAVVDRLREAHGWIDGLADREQERLGISRLSVDRNKTDGYYIQVPKADADGVPDEYEGIKTLKNAERYVFPPLEDREREIRRLEARREDIERAVIADLRETVADAAEQLQRVGQTLARFDVHVALATHAARYDWQRPTLADDDSMEIEAGRHPVVEQTVEFVPNDLELDRDRRFLIVTGPNMSGKSTYMRQVALIALLAQAGSFVPASSARLGLQDGIYTRVGALDELAGGRSTFMVEMQELSNILHSATQDSLVILDEVGRGTATVDGIAIAWAATEYLHNTVGAKTLFATHYHELTQLADHLDGVANVHMTATERDGEVTFRRTVDTGRADRSYGVHVADLAGVPDPVVDRAADVLDRLRADEAIDVRGDRTGEDTEQVVFDLEEGQLDTMRPASGADPEPEDAASVERSPETEAVLQEIREAELAELSPVEVMAKIDAWQERLEE